MRALAKGKPVSKTLGAGKLHSKGRKAQHIKAVKKDCVEADSFSSGTEAAPT